MKVKIIVIGKTDFEYIQTGIDLYLRKLKHYTKIEWLVLPHHKSHGDNASSICKAEANLLTSYFEQADVNILLDENGKSFDSIAFSSLISNYQIQSKKQINFYVGGAYGFDSELKSKADLLLSFSKFTFTHAMIRLLLLEQIYRAYTIINHEKYHHI